jgi:toxin ParE1/3/4
MLELVWEPQALDQLDGIMAYIAERNFAAAERLERQFQEKIALACHVPGVGRPGRVNGTRELVIHPNYLAIYRVSEGQLKVVRVLHARQQYP